MSLTTEIEMTEEKEEWTEIDVPEKETVEYEIEEEEEKVEAKAEPEVEEKPEPEIKKEEEEDSEPELEGIETKGAQKRIRQLIRQRKERDEEVEKLIEQNRQLASNLQSKEQEVFNLSKNSIASSEKQLTDKIELAREAYLEAFEDGDQDKVLKAQEMLNEAQLDLKSVHTVKSNFPDEYKPQAPQQQQAAQPRIDRRAQEWASDNSWFGQDKVMTAAALAIDADLKEQGYSPDDEEFYEEVNNRIKEAFPHKFGEVEERVQETTSQPAQVVSGGSRSSPNSGKKIKLSKEDVSLAQKWGIPLEKYAAEKLKVTKADGEYTTVNM